MSEKSTEKNHQYGASQKWLISLIACGFIIIRIAWPGLTIDAVTLGLLAIVALPWLPELIDHATFPGGWEVTFRQFKEVQKEQEQQKGAIADQKGQIDAILLLLKRMVTEYEFKHMERFATTEPFEVNRNKTPYTFVDELRHLRGVGFLVCKQDKTIQGLWEQLQEHGSLDVKEYVSITGAGNQYLHLRKSLETS